MSSEEKTQPHYLVVYKYVPPSFKGNHVDVDVQYIYEHFDSKLMAEAYILLYKLDIVNTLLEEMSPSSFEENQYDSIRKYILTKEYSYIVPDNTPGPIIDQILELLDYQLKLSIHGSEYFYPKCSYQFELVELQKNSSHITIHVLSDIDVINKVSKKRKQM